MTVDPDEVHRQRIDRRVEYEIPAGAGRGEHRSGGRIDAHLLGDDPHLRPRAPRPGIKGDRDQVAAA